MQAPKNTQELKCYLAWSEGADLLSEKLEDILSQSYSTLEGASPKKEFITSWERTREKLLIHVKKDGRLDNHAFLFEFRPIPGRKFAVDLMILGASKSGFPSITVVEIKMWSAVTKVKDGYCYLGPKVERHPLDQAKLYTSNINLTHSICTQHGGIINSCTFVPLTLPKPGTGNQKLLNYPKVNSPNFTTVNEMIEFHLNHAPNAYLEEHLSLLKSRKLHTSPSLAAFALLPFTGNTGINLSNEQDEAASAILESCKNNKRGKRVIIVSGGPGTGKSVIALKVFGEMMKKNIGAFRYLTNSANFRDYLKGMLYTYIFSSKDNSMVDFDAGNSRVDYLVEKFTAIWEGSKKDTYRLLIADEAQSIELRHKDGNMYKQTLTPPVIDIILQAEVSAFFLDPKQAKKRTMVGTVEHIKTAAKLLDVEVIEFELNKQFRCGQKDEVVEILEELYGHVAKPNLIEKVDIKPFEIKVFECIHELEKKMEHLPCDDLKRIIAGFAWPWKKGEQKNNNYYDVSFMCRCGKMFERSWNIDYGTNSNDPRKSNGYIHATKEDFQSDILSIHTTQGIEFDHVGIILGDDVLLNPSGELTFKLIKGTDSSVNETEIANNYRTISSRATSSLYLYAVNQNVSNKIKRYLDKRLIQ